MEKTHKNCADFPFYLYKISVCGMEASLETHLIHLIFF